ncbi:carboxymuconolactone decarboxylase family protein [Thalassococcus sp. CAU 1522]|uniref:Carboxymuconolactone decarboxylase family protein n=1 Tax=Thalassococcus arenae TaxID=2851652 RepID=A0ABS6N8C2_9RHOB|nr:carboxymuconolactone decarboxylase family protein [Thalassococcus arenae]MBV2360254.1 carboxymuconolactone decarboxylase family protein [Thalassococcus arenae]
MPKLPNLPDTAILADLLRLHPGHAGALMGYIDDLMRGPGEWDIAERELIAAFVSARNACTYCLGAHVLYAEAFGIAPDRLQAALDDPATAGLDPELAAMLGYLEHFQTLPQRARQADMDKVLAAGVSEAAIVQALLIAGAFQMMNRVAEGTGVTTDLRTAPQRHGLSGLDDPRSHRFTAPKPQDDTA